MDDVLYTIMPISTIFEEDTKPGNYQEIIYDGIQMQVEHIHLNKFKIIRLYSTDPADYLKTYLQPGEIINI
ncbi:MAG: hypothetical protein GX923_05460 [Clostridia bacterium]|jgi:hypothetical protein|nr:hypothetical protein [Clostridia bacterium]